MKSKIMKFAVSSVLWCLVLTGLTYSLLALTSKPAYAATCNCEEEYLEAEMYCAPYGGIVNWICPDGEYVVAQCNLSGEVFAEYCPNT